MSGWDYKGNYTSNEDEGTESDPSRSVLNRWRMLNLMRPPGLTHVFFRIMSMIAQVVPPGSRLKKSRRQLATDAGTNERTVRRFYKWAYRHKLMTRNRGNRGFSDKVWPMYETWVYYATLGLSRITDDDRREKEAGHVSEFATALGVDVSKLPFPERGRDTLSLGRDVVSGGVRTQSPESAATNDPRVGTQCPPRTGSLTGLELKGGTKRENGPASERAPRRASQSSGFSLGKTEEQKGAARERIKGKPDRKAQKRASDLWLFYERESQDPSSKHKDWEYSKRWLEGTQFRHSLDFARHVHRECFDPILSFGERTA